eukprot:CCRYP_000649-RA/>CCRYP_000649-RA protein AED:0.39 eAED:0.39 QI:0/0/0/1/0/0/2/0/167
MIRREGSAEGFLGIDGKSVGSSQSPKLLLTQAGLAKRVSCLQTEITLSTMEAEYVALSTACKDLFPLVDLISELSRAVGLDVNVVPNMHVKVHEDNVGALTLAGMEPRRMTPHSKHYAIKYHWFREHVHARRVHLLKIDSLNQLGDMFTKGLGAPAFTHLRSLVMGW